MKWVLLALFVFAGIVLADTTPRSQALLTSLPGVTSLPPFDQYTGYINLEGTTKNIFYWFVTAATNPADKPVLLWLQGGPGCSGLGDGFLLEHGPFSPFPSSFTPPMVNLTNRFYSWNKEANIIYIESPCGVGFSYGDTAADYTSNDNTTAYDNYLFLDGFFQIYNEYADNEFWVTGESYGGIYITTLAYQILNNSTNTQLTNNLKSGGLMLGNPVTNCDTPDYTGSHNILSLSSQVYNYYWHGMVSRRNYDLWNSKGCNTASPPSLAECESLFITVTSGIGQFDQPLELQKTQAVKDLQSQKQSGQPDAAVDPDMLYYSFCTGNGTLDFNVDTITSCFGLTDQVDTYFNTLAVQQAINAKIGTNWQECGGVLYDKTVSSVIPYLENFFTVAPDMRIMYYSGDVDIATVPFPQTQRCLETMQRPITEKWRPWTVNKEVAGYIEVYDTYTYATVKAAGHEAPQFQQQSNYVLFQYFLAGNLTLPQ